MALTNKIDCDSKVGEKTITITKDPKERISTVNEIDGSSKNDLQQNIIIVQNSNELNIDELDPSLLKYVKQVLADVESQHNNSTEDGAEKQPTTYIIDLNTFTRPINTTQDCSSGLSETVSLDENQALVSDDQPENSAPAISNALDLDCQQEIEISFVSCVTDLKNHESHGSVETVPSESHHVVPSVSTAIDSQAISKNLSSDGFTSSQQSTAKSLKVPTFKLSAGNNFESKASTSGEHLNIAKKIINDSRKLLPGGKVNLNQEVEITEEKCGSDSVITMYLSSPNELKDKIKNLKTDSPVLVMQAGESSSTIGKELEVDLHTNDQSLITQVQNAKPGTSSLSNDASNSSDGSTSDVVAYHCIECGYSSHNKHYYKQHVDLVHNEDRPYKCPHCDYAGKRRHALLEHLVVHSNQRPFTCDHCNASFRKKGHLTNHIKLHTSQKLIHCGVCNIQLPDSEAFEAHLHKIHNTDKLYKCKLCEHTVVDRETMLKHLHTHNESATYSCPKCSALLNSDESLINHLKTVHDILLVDSQIAKGCNANAVNINPVKIEPESVLKPYTPSIICSECGFVCSNNEVMQKHMWAHINGHDKHSKIKINPDMKDQDTSVNNTMGVLKMNVDLGQKTLPNNVVYQCTGCSFTSSDNSVFIKHMLAHKTQEKRRVVTSEPTKFNQATSINSQTTQKSKLSSSFTENVKEKRSDSIVPFIYDEASARFRCIICGYHCEFQRTIKAHIWKHSGHQSIEYPTFDQSSSSKSTSQLASNESGPRRVGEPESSQDNHYTIAQPLTSHSVPQLHQARNSELVQSAQPVSHTANSSPGESIHAIDSNSAAQEKSTAASRLLETIAYSAAQSRSNTAAKKNPGLLSHLALTDTKFSTSVDNTITNTPSLPLKSIEDQNNSLITSSDHNITSKVLFTTLLNNMQTSYIKKENMLDVDEGCTEPSVVVEVMDTVSSESDLTGLSSQHGSPRILELDSAGDIRLSNPFTSHEKMGKNFEASLNASESNQSDSEVRPADPSKNHHSYSVRLRCPICDRQLREDFKSHLMMCQKKSDDDKSKSLKVKSKGLKTSTVSQRLYDNDNLPTEDTDSTESSDELTLSGDSSGFSQQKSGICSSLLAVIEQLRERSRSESEEDKHGSNLFKKGKKKQQNDEDSNVESVDDLQNIEKISDSGNEKYRCSLCHYSSQRICNIKLHMKTHRQKKPSECSLCDFSSTSPEALQDHMLKHCKVRTYACKFCPQSFNHKSTLRAHLRAHKDQEPFLCAYCVFETTNPMEYREHMQVHSGCSSRLRCPGCDLILNNKEELTTHLLKCKGTSKKVKPLVSSHEKSAVHKQIAKLEEQITSNSGSTNHACVVSGCSFSSTSLMRLQDHLSVHCNPSLLVCNLCDFKALHIRSLKSHMKRHSNDQRYVQQPLEQYKCNLCGYVCHHLPSLKSHMWRHASDQSYSYEFTNDVINAAIDHDTRVEADGEPDDPELLDRVINSERRILEGELTKCNKGDGQRPICWVTFRCCSCGFETINKAKLNIHMRSHSDIIQQALDLQRKSQPSYKTSGKRLHTIENIATGLNMKVARISETI
ncbi:uncharacterized protein LOC131950662 [Physella acuta]|uniref:uncharacterized protein LOC131950662 n=1 Tax=Physella acuta TaxID=109671 RepID=UPI0027DE43E0|nr:uncharacterized protein LOC131950662 [Physella acuta]XP_059168861.1 uncharacterized protein LOC131950662 [Physella acuta]